jgi:co-chaperonin GroES (HSP10)
MNNNQEIKPFKGQARNSNVVVKLLKQENIVGGLDLTSKEDKDQKFKRAVVLSLGDNCPKDESNEFLIPIGSEILFDQHKGTPLTLEGENYEVIYFADIMVTL